MRIKYLALGATLAIALAAPRPAAADQPTLNLFIWSAYLNEAIIDGFELECACKVVETDYASNAEMEAKLRAGGASQYDVVVPSGRTARPSRRRDWGFWRGRRRCRWCRRAITCRN
jgi:spermidine/putrescine transport system substrate-binding protein